MIARAIRYDIENALRDRTAVILDGLPRVGRTKLAATWIEKPDSMAATFDASEAAERQCFSPPTPFLELVEGHLVVIENVDSRSIDAIAQFVRQAGNNQTQTRFLLITRSPRLSRLLAQQVAGHVKVIEVVPIRPDEAFEDIDLKPAPDIVNLDVQLEASPTPVSSWNLEAHWLRGGLPESLGAPSDEVSFQWRHDYLAALLNGDFSDWEISAGDRVPDLVARIVAAHGQIFDEEKCRSDLAIDRNSVRRSIDMLIGIGLIRRLPNWVRGHPVLYVRDAGLFHALHGMRTLDVDCC